MAGELLMAMMAGLVVSLSQGAPTRDEQGSLGTDCPGHVHELADSNLFDREDLRLTRGTLLVVEKAHRRLMAFDGGTLRACFRVGLGFEPRGHKEVEGDGRTPEGWYRTSDKPWSSFAGAIAIHYPSPPDARRAYRRGRITKRVRDSIVAAHRARRVPPQRTVMGGEILIHGGGSGSDWTLGCIALDEPDLRAVRAFSSRGMRTDLLVLP